MRSFALSLLILAACAGGDSAQGPFAVRDSAGVRIAVSASQVWTFETRWQLSREPALQIGVVEGAADQQLFRVGAGYRLADGSVVIANAGTSEVRLYDPSGALAWAAGAEGDGPGEFRSLGSVSAMAGDSIAAFDPQLVRLTVFSRDGQLGRVMTLSRAAPSGQHFPIGVTPSGHVIARLGWSSANDPSDLRTGRRRLQDVIVRYGVDDGSIDTLGVFPGSEQMTVVNGSARSFGVPPFAWGRVDALRADDLLVAYTERFEFQVLNAQGEVSEIVRGGIEPEPVTREEIDSYLEEARDRLRENPPTNPMSRELSELRLEATTFPPTHPVIDRMIVDLGGNVWLRHARPAAVIGPFSWSVFEAGGRWLGRAELPERLRPLEIGDEYVLGVTTDPMGVEYVEVYGLRKP
jgi:hypothetical protein